MKKLTLILTLIFTTYSTEYKKVQLSNNQDGIANCESNQHNCENHNSLNFNTLNYEPNETILIVGLDNVTYEKLLLAEKILKKFYKHKTMISPFNAKLEPEFFLDGDTKTINADKFVKTFKNEYKTIYITNRDMYSLGVYCRGYTTINGKTILTGDGSFMEETIKHEVGHTYGLRHCTDLTCIMAINNDNYDSGTFCDKCKKTINYY